MGILNKLFSRAEAGEGAFPVGSTTCPHTALLPKWDNLDDMGIQEKITGYRCDACGSTFTPAEVRELRNSEAARIRTTD